MERLLKPLSSLVVCLAFSVLAASCNIQASSNLEPSISSHDNKYTLCRMDGQFNKENNERVSTFLILNPGGNGLYHIQFDPQIVWPYSRLIWITWGKKDYNIWAYSSDTGFYFFQYADGFWKISDFSYEKNKDGNITVKYSDEKGTPQILNEESLPDDLVQQLREYPEE